MKGYYRELIALLRTHGFEFFRSGKGDHELWSKGKSIVVVPFNLKNKNTANGILKQAEIPDRL
jgi:predicted RNA binding protein YcfA (HicA-like mRNA interferase family)